MMQRKGLYQIRYKLEPQTFRAAISYRKPLKMRFTRLILWVFLSPKELMAHTLLKLQLFLFPQSLTAWTMQLTAYAYKIPVRQSSKTRISINKRWCCHSYGSRRRSARSIRRPQRVSLLRKDIGEDIVFTINAKSPARARTEVTLLIEETAGKDFYRAAARRT